MAVTPNDDTLLGVPDALNKLATVAAVEKHREESLSRKFER